MLSVVYPYQVKSLAEDVDTRHGFGRSRRYPWVLDIAGEFCFWPKRIRASNPADIDRVANSVSALLGLAARTRHNEEAHTVLVQISKAEKEYLIAREYNRLTRKAS